MSGDLHCRGGRTRTRTEVALQKILRAPQRAAAPRQTEEKCNLCCLIKVLPMSPVAQDVRETSVSITRRVQKGTQSARRCGSDRSWFEIPSRLNGKACARRATTEHVA